MATMGIRVCGDVKQVVLTLKAIGCFHKTVQAFVEATKHYTQEQKARYIRLIVAIYQQTSGCAVNVG